MDSDEPAGRVAALFDVDHTLLEVNSGRKWVEHLWKLKRISVPDALRSIWWLAQYRLSLLDYESMTAQVVGSYRGQPVAELEAEVIDWYRDEISPWICQQARERVAWHQAQGHVTAMLTAGPAFSTAPLQEELGIEHLLCTEIEVADGVLTGRHFPPACYGQGKLRAAVALAARERLDLGRSYFYTDSYSDLPTLEVVGHPRVINPDPRLRRHAQATGWGWEAWAAKPQ